MNKYDVNYEDENGLIRHFYVYGRFFDEAYQEACKYRKPHEEITMISKND